MSEIEEALSSALARAEDAERKSDEYLDGLRRTAADFENYRKRIRREREAEQARAAERVIRELLTVVDDLERAIEHSQGETQEGLGLVWQKLLGVLESEGAEEIPVEGQFNPHVHEAVTAIEGPEGEILELIQRGWSLQGRVIRPAKVIVGRDGD